MRTRILAVGVPIALVAALLVISGCDQDSGTGATERKAPGTKASGAFGGRTLPIQAYFLTPEQEQVVHRAAQRLVAPCMEAQGFSVGLPDQLQPAAGHHQPDFLDRRYDAVYDEATARRYGYHLPIQVDLGSQMPPTSPEYTPEVASALYGDMETHAEPEELDVDAGRTSYGGCMGKAEQVLAKGTSYIGLSMFWAQPVRLLALDHAPQGDPRLAVAQTKWSACMAEKGYRISNTISEFPEPSFDLTTPTPSKAEVAMALWDVACQERTQVVQIAFEVESEYELKKIDEQAEVFAQIRDENTLLVERAATLLGEDVP